MMRCCRERVGSSQNSPSSSRSLPPLAPALEAANEAMLVQSYPNQQQRSQYLQGFPVGIKLEHSPGASFSPNSMSRAAQSAAVANLGAAPPSAGSPGSLSRTSSSHLLPAGVNPMGPPRTSNTPAWLCQPLSTPMPFPPQRVYQLEGVPAIQSMRNGRGGFSPQQPATQSPQMTPHNGLSMSRTLSEADISNQSAMSALTGSSVQRGPPPPSPATASRQSFQMPSLVAGNPHYMAVSPQKLRASMSYQDLSCNTFKLESPQSLHTPQNLPPLQPQQQSPNLQAHQQQQQQLQQQPTNMMVRVGSETHFIPETQANYFGLSRVPSAPFMQSEQENSGGTPHFLLHSPVQSENNLGLPNTPQFGQWAPDSRHVLGVKQQEVTDMQVCLTSSH